MIDHVRAYLAGGTSAMGQIVDKQQPKALSAEFQALLKNSPYLPAYIPEFDRSSELSKRGTTPAPRMSSTGPRTTRSRAHHLHHPHHPSNGRPNQGTVVALKTLYASHFFNAALEMIVAVDTPNHTGMYLMNLYRTRIDPPTGMLSGVLMGRVKAGVEQGVAENLKTAKTRMESK